MEFGRSLGREARLGRSEAQHVVARIVSEAPGSTRVSDRDCRGLGDRCRQSQRCRVRGRQPDSEADRHDIDWDAVLLHDEGARCWNTVGEQPLGEGKHDALTVFTDQGRGVGVQFRRAEIDCRVVRHRERVRNTRNELDRTPGDELQASQTRTGGSRVRHNDRLTLLDLVAVGGVGEIDQNRVVIDIDGSNDFRLTTRRDRKQTCVRSTRTPASGTHDLGEQDRNAETVFIDGDAGRCGRRGRHLAGHHDADHRDNGEQHSCDRGPGRLALGSHVKSAEFHHQ